ncbi:MAG: hypothetical protein AAF639_35355 [Chloroflexota bacterium]
MSAKLDNEQPLADICTTQENTLQNECEALVILYETTAGDSWQMNGGWLTEASICDWTGVGCMVVDNADTNGAQRHVTRINLSANQLTGTIPTELINLTQLRQLDLSGNQLTDEIPLKLGSFDYLETLLLHDNQLTGPLPFEFGDMLSLRTLDVSQNQLTGGLPSGFAQLTNLHILKLHNNNLSGVIPLSLTEISTMTTLTFAQTDLCVPIETQFQTWAVALDELSVSAYTCPSLLQIDVRDFSFQPSIATIRVGATVRWVNHDTVVHTIVNTSVPQWFDSGNIETGEIYTMIFDEAGTYPYINEVFPDMTGEIVVYEHLSTLYFPSIYR